MSGISSGIGLISGIDRGALIDQLMEIEARPVRTLEQRIRAIDTRRTAFLELEAKLLSLQNAAARLDGSTNFRRFSATSSDERSLRATAGDKAVAGSFSFRVRSVASQHILLSRGFADADRTAIGAGTITVESSAAQISRGTILDDLNGGRGVRRGVIRIIDQSGASADIDLSAALTVSDVLDAINQNAQVRVRATVTGQPVEGATGDRIVITDATGQANGNLTITDRSGFAATDLGISGVTTTGRLDGKDLIRIEERLDLSQLNDGNGVGRASAGGEDDLRFETAYGNFSVSLADVLKPQTHIAQLNNGQGVRLGIVRVTDRSGRSAEVDLTQAVTVEDVRSKLEAADVAVSVSIVDSNLQLRDTTDSALAAKKNLKVEDVTGHAAADLGIAADVASDTISGKSVFRVSTVGDVMRAINYAPGNASFVRATIGPDGKGLQLTAMGLGNTVRITSSLGSTAARDLGLEGAVFHTDTPFETRRLISGLNTVLLSSIKGGAGVAGGSVRFTDRSGASSVIDFSQADTLQDVIDTINQDATIGLRAEFNNSRTGLRIVDETGGAGALSIADVNGSLATDLGIRMETGDFNRTTIEGGNVQLQYVSRSTKLSDLNPAASSFSGEFRIKDASGNTHVVGIASNLTTVGEVIDAINLRTPDSIEARVNATGDGILIVDHSQGTGTLEITDSNGGRTAANLRLAGKAKPGEKAIDGSAEYRLTLGAQETLNDLASRLNTAGIGITATVLRGGQGANPASLTITSTTSGRRGALVIDTGNIDLGLETLVNAQDAVITVGSGATAKVIAGAGNSFDDVVEGLTLDVLAPSESDVTVTIDQSLEDIVDSVRAFVTSFNEIQADIDSKTSFDEESLQRGPLLGDATVSLVRSRLQRVTLQPFGGSSQSESFLASVGLRRASNNRMEFDEARFREAYASDPAGVEAVFADKESGIGSVFKKTIEGFTDDFDGIFARRDSALADQKELLNRRIDGLNGLLEGKRERLEAQFIALEGALASLQGQQNALAGLIARQSAQ